MPALLKTHCARGHPFNEENVYYHSSGRGCRTCRRESRNRSRKQIEERRLKETSRTPLTDEQIRERHGALIAAALDAFQRDPDYIIRMAEDGKIASRRNAPQHVAIAFAMRLRNEGQSLGQIAVKLNAEGFRMNGTGMWRKTALEREMRRYS